MASRGNKPLFEIMREQAERQDRARNGSAGPASRPETRPVAREASAPVRRAVPRARAQERARSATITVPVTVLYVGIAGVLGLSVIMWTGGHAMGRRAAEQDLLSAMTTPSVESVVGEAAPAHEPVRETPGPVDPGPESVVARPGPGSILTQAGPVMVDPREPGWNYLNLGTLPEDQARSAVAFLRENGVEVIGVPVVDRRSPGANNQARFILFSMGLGVPPTRFMAKEVVLQRERHERLIADIGRRWQREQRGGSDFSDTVWTKYVP